MGHFWRSEKVKWKWFNAATFWINKKLNHEKGYCLIGSMKGTLLEEEEMILWDQLSHIERADNSNDKIRQKVYSERHANQF